MFLIVKFASKQFNLSNKGDKMLDKNELNEYALMANALRFLCADMVQNANSGHWCSMGLADIAVVLGFHIRLNPKILSGLIVID